jgi:phosphate-selective porin OprO/OprP
VAFNSEELSFAANWFFNGHRSKLTADVSLIDIDDPVTGSENDWRFRLQWDVSL